MAEAGGGTGRWERGIVRFVWSLTDDCLINTEIDQFGPTSLSSPPDRHRNAGRKGWWARAVVGPVLGARRIRGCSSAAFSPSENATAAANGELSEVEKKVMTGLAQVRTYPDAESQNPAHDPAS